MVTLLLWGILGWGVGGLINWLADQLPGLIPPKAPVCKICGEPYSVVRFLGLEDCRSCGARRTMRSWLVQILFPFSAVVISFFSVGRLPPVFSFILLGYFLLVAVIDIEHRLVLGSLTMAGMIIGCFVGVFLHGLVSTLIGGVSGAMIMWILYQAGRLFSRWVAARQGSSIDEEALGFGDVYIAGIIGLVLGWPGITVGLLLAIITGGLVSGAFLLGMLISRKYRPFSALPYAPFLLAATILLIYRP